MNFDVVRKLSILFRRVSRANIRISILYIKSFDNLLGTSLNGYKS
jgi:hypothetical protein